MILTWSFSPGTPSPSHELEWLHNDSPSWSHGQLVWVETYPGWLSKTHASRHRGTSCLTLTVGFDMLKIWHWSIINKSCLQFNWHVGNLTLTNHQQIMFTLHLTITLYKVSWHVGNTNKRTNTWATSHGSACNLYSFCVCVGGGGGRLFGFLDVPVCVSVRVCARCLHYKTLLTFRNLSFHQIFVGMPVNHKCIIWHNLFTTAICFSDWKADLR